MNIWPYLALRKSMFRHEIKHWLKQVEHMLTIVVIFLGTALPAFFYIVLMAFGVILAKPTNTNIDALTHNFHILVIVWALLLTQSLILMLCKSAILGNRYHYFIALIEPSVFTRHATNIAFALLASPLILILIGILLSIEASRWPEVPHGFLLLSLQISCMLTSVYSATRIYWVLAVILALMPFLIHLDLVNALLIYNAMVVILQIIAQYLPVKNVAVFNTLPIKLLVWLKACVGSQTSQLPGGTQSRQSASSSQANGMVLSSLSALLLLILSYYCALNLPDYKASVFFIGGQVLVLCCISLQIKINKTLEESALFFAQLTKNTPLFLLQYLAPLGLLTLTLVLSSIIFNEPRMLLFLVAGLVTLYFAKRSPHYFIIAWLLSALVSAGLFFGLF